MTFTTYSTTSTARRALKNALAKLELTPEMVMHEIVKTDVGFIVRVAADIAGFEMISRVTETDINIDVEPTPMDEAATPAAEEPKVKKPSGYIRGVSTALGPTKMVWAIADSMIVDGVRAARKDVLKACQDAGITYGTARTQYQQWLSATLASGTK